MTQEKRGGKRKKIIFFYVEVASLEWDLDRWRWMDGDHFLNYTTKDGKEPISNRNPDATRAGEK